MNTLFSKPSHAFQLFNLGKVSRKTRFLQRLGIALVLSSLIGTASWPVSNLPVQAQTVPYANTLARYKVDVTELRSHLQAQDWEAADNETRRILQSFVHANGDIFAEPIPTLIPPEVVQTLDQLWVEASGGRFGFSPQLEVWEQVRATHPHDATVAARAFGDRVGWTRSTPAPEDYIFVAPEWLTEPELNYSLEAPVGHLPWAGVDWSRIEAILSTQSCGSCMIDAMYLQSDRFGRYVPSLFHWLQTALTLPIPQTGSWQQAQWVRSIDLRSLYPASSCPVRAVSSAISPNGAVIAIGSYSYERSCPDPGESALALWNAQRGNRIITLHRGPALEAFSQGNPAQEPPTEGDRIVGDVANAVAFTPDSQFVAAGMSYGVIRLWRTDTGEQVQLFDDHQYAVRAIALSPDGQTLVSASADQTLKLWDVNTGELQRTITMAASDGYVHSLVFSPDGQRFATATNRNTLQLWEAQTGRLIRTLVSSETMQSPWLPLAFSPDGRTIATGDSDRTLKLWNTSNGARIITLSGHAELPKGLAFSPDGDRLASSDGVTGKLWDLSTYATVHTFDLVQTAGHPEKPSNIGHVAFSPDGQTLATSTLLLPLAESEPIPRQGITLWDVATGQPVEQIHQVTQFQFSPDGQFLMANGLKVQIWEPYSSLVNTAQ